MDELEERIDELAEQEELAAIRPELDGRQVMEHLGIAPGPLVGEALAFLLEIRLDEGEIGHDEAIKRLDAWWDERTAAADRLRSARIGPIPKDRIGRYPAAARRVP